MKITQKERNAIYLDKARSNTAKSSYRKLALIALIGSDFNVTTEVNSYRLKKFFGKLYYVYFK